MDRPILNNLISCIELNSKEDKAIYLQLSEKILLLIKQGHLKTGQKLPSTREIAKLLKINRITVGKAFEELQLQGWLESHVGRGTFVSLHIPDLAPTKLQHQTSSKSQEVAGFTLNEKQYLVNPYFVSTAKFHLDDGYPDPKLASLKELYRAYRNQLTRSEIYHKFGSYSFPDGSEITKKRFPSISMKHEV